MKLPQIVLVAFALMHITLVADIELHGKYFLGRVSIEAVPASLEEHQYNRAFNKIVVDRCPNLVGMDEENLFYSSPVIQILKTEAGYRFTTLSGSKYFVPKDNFFIVIGVEDFQRFYQELEVDFSRLPIIERLKENEIKDAIDRREILCGEIYKEYKYIDNLSEEHFNEANKVASMNVGSCINLSDFNEDLRFLLSSSELKRGS